MVKLQHAEKLLERAIKCECISLADCADLLLEREQSVSEPMKTNLVRR